LTPQRKKYNAFLPFSAISRKGNHFDKEYFDGGTSWNEEKKKTTSKIGGLRLSAQAKINGTKAKLDEDNHTAGMAIEELRSQAKRVGFVEKLSERKGIKWPGQIPNFDQCKLRAAMCCWVEAQINPKDGKMIEGEPRDNTDVCYVDLEKSQSSSHVNGGYTIFDRNTEGPVNCHGFAWEKNPTKAGNILKGSTLFEIAMADKMYKKGYVGNIPGAPMCACVEQVSRPQNIIILNIKLRSKFLLFPIMILHRCLL